MAARRWEQAELLPLDCENDAQSQGVGARRTSAPLPGRGGGYLNEPTPSKIADEASTLASRIASLDLPARELALIGELEAMGLSATLLHVAVAIGFDAFMAAWRVLDGADELRTENGSGIALRMPRMSAYRRYQRNRFVEQLAAAGFTQPEIRLRVKRDLGEEISNRHTRRLMSTRRVKR